MQNAITKVKNFFDKKNIKLLSVLSTLIVLLVILLVKGVYPFGKNTISSCDMTQSYITFYHHLYDCFHNGKNLFYSFNLGMGSNIYGGAIMDGFLNPTSWLILFSSRDNILYFMTYIVIAKFLVTAFTTSLFIEKTFPKLDKKFQLLGTLLYTFSAYSLINYGNIMWIDIVSIFPLLCLGIKQILEENKKTLFTIALAFCLINNYNLSYMILFFLLFCVPFAIKYYAKNKRLAAFQIVSGIILSIGLSAFAFIPALIQTMNSYRMSGIVVNKTENIYLFYKLANILFYSTPILLTLPLLKELKKDNQVKIIIGSITTSFILPLIFERVNLQWHTGSYQLFPFRYGFIINFILTCSMLYSINKYGINKIIKTLKTKFSKLKTVVALIILLITSGYLIYQMHNNVHLYQQFCIPEQLMPLLILFITSSIIVIQIINGNKKNITKYILMLNIFLITVFSLAMFSPNKKYLQKEFSDETINIANQIAKDLDIKEDLYRLKDTTYSMTENYPLVTNIPSNSTFLHIISSDQVLNYQELGYGSDKTKLIDLGGTIISDTIYGNKYLVSNKKLNSSIYKLIKKTNNYYYYENPYVKFIYPISNNPKEKTNSKNVFEASNILAKEILGIETDLLKIQENNCQTTENKTTCTLSTKNDMVYFYSTDTINKIIVNDETITIPSINDSTSTEYRSITPRIIDFGTYNTDITIELYHQDKINFMFATLNEQKYKDAFSDLDSIDTKTKKNKLTIKYNNKDSNKGLFIPINYDTGFTATLNSKPTKIKKILNNFIYIELNKGQNKIELEFIPSAFKPSLIATIITTLIVIIIAIYERKRKEHFKEIKFITYPIYYISIITIALATYKVYISPIIHTFIK